MILLVVGLILVVVSVLGIVGILINRYLERLDQV